MNFLHHILVLLITAPLVGILLLILVPSKNEILLKKISLITSCFAFLISITIWYYFNNSTSMFQFVSSYKWIQHLNVYYTFGVDGISFFFLILTTLLFLLCFLFFWDSIKKKLKHYLILLLLIEFFLLGAFCALDILFFYICFESVLIPIFLIIGIWGSRERKIKASYYFFFFTLSGSVLMLLSILYIIYQAGTSDYEIVSTFSFSFVEQKFLWLAFFISFAIKIPIVPVHLWLPEAHVEAPTSGSVILAGVILKLGTYGFIRFLLPLFSDASYFFSPLVYFLSTTSFIYSSLTAVRQNDLKKILAYSSIAHMNLVILGIFSFNVLGVEGAILQSLSHGLVSSSLFLLIGVLYDRHKTRTIKYYGGLTHNMPVFVSFFFFFTMANMAFPGTSSFIGEFLLLASINKFNTSITFISVFTVVLSSCYSLWLFNKISFGNIKLENFQSYIDINKKELHVFSILTLFIIFLGVYPQIVLISLHSSVNKTVEILFTAF